jgi:hypothetical protein
MPQKKKNTKMKNLNKKFNKELFTKKKSKKFLTWKMNTLLITIKIKIRKKKKLVILILALKLKKLK